MTVRHITALLALLCISALAFAGGSAEDSASTGTREVTVVLDWVPNTNHTGIYVALARGFYEQAGLDVTIELPGEAGSIAPVATGVAQFGISYQEEITFARASRQQVPVRAIATIAQRNTSGFAWPADAPFDAVSELGSRSYGSYGSPIEEAIVRHLISAAGGDGQALEVTNIGTADFFQAVTRLVDFAWIFYGWTGIEAEVRGFPLDFVGLTEIDPSLEFYTPVVIAGDELLAENPALVRDFLAATERGYRFATDNPEIAAEILVEAAPEISDELAHRSQRFLAGQGPGAGDPVYLSASGEWGVMDPAVWEGFTAFMLQQGLITQAPEAGRLFTNEFLPRTGN